MPKPAVFTETVQRRDICAFAAMPALVAALLTACLSGPIAAAQSNAGPSPAFSPEAITDLLRDRASADKPSNRSGNAPQADVAVAASTTSTSIPNAITAERVNATRFRPVSAASRTVDLVVLKAEVLLDRAHAPPGVIDGRFGSNFTKAVSAFQSQHGLPVDGHLTRRVWDELGGDQAPPVFGTYTVKPEDVVGPFYPDLSPDYADQASMPDLGYRSAEEMFGERFHMDHRFLREINAGLDIAVAGTVLTVALVDALPIVSPIARIDVDKGKGQVLAFDDKNALVVAYPATIGSDDLPSPSGSYVVRGIAPHPTYTYDPKKNFQQGNNVRKLILPPGPNNPVGAAFIALSKPTYGIHGTPDPTKIDKTRSHGCVRLTNWNAVELAGLVKPGVPVNFIEKPGAPDPDSGEPTIASLLNATTLDAAMPDLGVH